MRSTNAGGPGPATQFPATGRRRPESAPLLLARVVYELSEIYHKSGGAALDQLSGEVREVETMVEE
jgi:hypothetical protein